MECGRNYGERDKMFRAGDYCCEDAIWFRVHVNDPLGSTITG